MIRRIPVGTSAFALFAVTIAALSLTGCATELWTPKNLAPKEMDTQAKQFSPPADRAYVYVIRHYAFTGIARDLSIELNGKVVGHIQNDTYALYDVAPGSHRLVMGILRPDATPTERFFVPAALDLSTQPGRVYFITSLIKSAGAEIRIVPQEEGMRMLKEDGYELVVTNY